MLHGEPHSPSKAYDNFFENYEEIRGEDGRVLRRYIGRYYICTLPTPQLRRQRALYAALWLFSAGLLVFCAVARLAANTVWYVTLPQALSLFSLGWTALGFVRLCRTPEKMEARQYRETVLVLRRGALLSAISLGMMALGYLLSLFLLNREALLRVPLSLAAAVATLPACHLERRVEYKILDNTE